MNQAMPLNVSSLTELYGILSLVGVSISTVNKQVLYSYCGMYICENAMHIILNLWLIIMLNFLTGRSKGGNN